MRSFILIESHSLKFCFQANKRLFCNFPTAIFSHVKNYANVLLMSSKPEDCCAQNHEINSTNLLLVSKRWSWLARIKIMQHFWSCLTYSFSVTFTMASKAQFFYFILLLGQTKLIWCFTSQATQKVGSVGQQKIKIKVRFHSRFKPK